MVGNVFSQNFSFSSCALGPWIVILIFSSFEHNYLRTHSYSTYVHSVHYALRVLFLCSRVQKAAMEYWIFSTLLFYTNFYTVNSYSKCISKWSIEESVKHLNKSTSALEFFFIWYFYNPLQWCTAVILHEGPTESHSTATGGPVHNIQRFWWNIIWKHSMILWIWQDTLATAFQSETRELIREKGEKGNSFSCLVKSRNEWTSSGSHIYICIFFHPCRH